MAISNALSNRRRLKRHRLQSDVDVIDPLKQCAIGKLVDIHQEGLLLLGQLLQMDSCHQVEIVLPVSVNLQQRFTLGLECLWCQSADEDGSLFWIGCSIIDKSPLASGCIESLINVQS